MMKIVILSIVILLVCIAAIILYKLSGKKPEKPLAAGDYVMFRKKYSLQYPNVPTTHAMRVEKIADGKATVVFVTTRREILSETVPLSAIVKAR